MPEVEVLALVAERTGGRPGFEDEVDAFLEILAVEGRVGVVGQLLGAGAAHPAGYHAAL